MFARAIHTNSYQFQLEGNFFYTTIITVAFALIFMRTEAQLLVAHHILRRNYLDY